MGLEDYARSIPLEGLVLVKDELECGASFMVALLIRRALQDGSKVLLVSTGRSATSWQQVLRKLAIVMSRVVDQGQLHFVDASAALLEMARGIYARHTPSEADPVPTSAGMNPEDGPADCQQHQEVALAQLHADIIAGLRALQQAEDPLGQSGSGTAASGTNTSSCSSRIVLIFDSLSAVAALQTAPDLWLDFLASLWQLPSSCIAASADSSGGGAVALVAVAHADVDGDQRWMRWLEHEATSVVELESADVGQLSDVNALVSVTVRRPEALLGAAASTQEVDPDQPAEMSALRRSFLAVATDSQAHLLAAPAVS